MSLGKGDSDPVLVADHRGRRGRAARLLHLPNLGCTQGATIALTIVAGPLNYVGHGPQDLLYRAEAERLLDAPISRFYVVFDTFAKRADYY